MSAIKGYRDLAPSERNMINASKELAEKVGEFVEHLRGLPGIDERWLDIAEIDMKKGFMGLVRAIAQPTTF